jgi:hypothetical protein
MYGYHQLMKESYLAHKFFKNEWADWRNGRLKKSKALNGNVEPESVTKARNEFLQRNDELFVLKLYPLEKNLRENPHSAFAELVEFLSVDVAAFRCGYAKEVFLQRLKQIELTASETKEVQQIALKMCETENVRREFRRWTRLMIKLADEQFVFKLEKLVISDNYFAKLKAKWMIEMIQKHHSDLRIKQGLKQKFL